MNSYSLSIRHGLSPMLPRDAHGAAVAREIAFLLGTYPDVVQMALRTPDPGGVVSSVLRLSCAISSAWETAVVKGEADVERAGAGTGSVVSVCVRWTCLELRCGC